MPKARRSAHRKSQQIADRFHLILNLSATMERVLEERSRQLILPPVEDPAAVTHQPAAVTAQRRCSGTAAAPPTQSQLRRQRRLERYEQVVALFKAGQSQAAISRDPGHGKEDHPALAAARTVSRTEAAAPSATESERVCRLSPTTLE